LGYKTVTKKIFQKSPHISGFGSSYRNNLSEGGQNGA
jgi:hypothetical protein